jgi:hypothetical protein
MILQIAENRYEYTWSEYGNSQRHRYDGRFASCSTVPEIKRMRSTTLWGYNLSHLRWAYKELLPTMVTPLG